MRTFFFAGVILLAAHAMAASPLCDLNLNGMFKGQNGNTLRLTQTHCTDLKLVDLGNQNTVWDLDLSGERTTTIPKTLITQIMTDKKSSVLERLAVQTIAIRLIPKGDSNGRIIEHALITGSLPIPNPGRLNEDLLVRIRLEFDIDLQRDYSPDKKISSFWLNPTVLAIDDVVTSSKSAISDDNSFLMGANTVLDYIKGILSTTVRRLQ